MAAEAPQRPPIAPSETRNVAISFDDLLDEGESISSVDSDDVTITPSGGLSASNIAVTVAARTINDESVAAGRAVTMRVTGALLAHVQYTVTIQPTTDASQTPLGTIYIPVKES